MKKSLRPTRHKNKIVIFSALLGALIFSQNVSAKALTILSWNLGWLTLKTDITQGIRNENDYLQMQKILQQINPDLFAFQEVDSLNALGKILDLNHYHVFFSDRVRYFEQTKRSQQFTGWAVKKQLTVIDHPDLSALGLKSFGRKPYLRYGSYIEVLRENKPSLHLLSVHLKSGCFSKAQLKSQTKSCGKLERQANVLADWINEQVEKQHKFVIAGDFNHYLGDPKQWLWDQLHETLNGYRLINLSEKTHAKCKVKQYNYRTKTWEHRIYNRLIDHILVGQKAPFDQVPTIAKQYQFDYHTTTNYQLSDHCPLYVTL